jgi:hypothetical protein
MHLPGTWVNKGKKREGQSYYAPTLSNTVRGAYPYLTMVRESQYWRPALYISNDPCAGKVSSGSALTVSFFTFQQVIVSCSPSTAW